MVFLRLATAACTICWTKPWCWCVCQFEEGRGSTPREEEDVTSQDEAVTSHTYDVTHLSEKSDHRLQPLDPVWAHEELWTG